MWLHIILPFNLSNCVLFCDPLLILRAIQRMDKYLVQVVHNLSCTLLYFLCFIIYIYIGPNWNIYIYIYIFFNRLQPKEIFHGGRDRGRERGLKLPFNFLTNSININILVFKFCQIIPPLRFFLIWNCFHLKNCVFWNTHSCPRKQQSTHVQRAYQ